MDDLSQRIDEAMRVRGMSQADLCRATKMGSSKISYILQGKTTDPRISTLIKIADALDISLDYLAGTRDDAAPRLTREESVLLSDYRDCTPERRRKASDAVRDQRVLSQAQEVDGRSFDDLMAQVKAWGDMPTSEEVRAAIEHDAKKSMGEYKPRSVERLLNSRAEEGAA